jgi:hypothetical protein
MAEDNCPECGAPVAGGRAGCQALFEEVGLRAFSDARYGAVHRLVVDAYAMQHPEPYCHSAKSYAAHLTGLCCGVERGGNPGVYRAINQWLNGKAPIDKPQVLTSRGQLTIANLRVVSSAEEHIKRAREWAKSVWEAYGAQHELARQWIEAALRVKTVRWALVRNLPRWQASNIVFFWSALCVRIAPTLHGSNRMEVSMADAKSVSITRLITVPALITLVVTIVRLVGELQHWGKPWVGNEAGGGAALIGISWLPIIFGPYFAWKLAAAGDRPASGGKAIGFAFVSLAVFVLAGFSTRLTLRDHKPTYFTLIPFVLMLVAAFIPRVGWRSLGNTLLAYAFAARVPVLVVMYVAMSANGGHGWGTHYDAVDPMLAQASLITKWAA